MNAPQERWGEDWELGQDHFDILVFNMYRYSLQTSAQLKPHLDLIGFIERHDSGHWNVCMW